MSIEQINAAIAEACGWKEVRVNGDAGIYKGFDNGAELRPDIPDYCNDLNAMAEAEKHISQDIWNVYINQLAKVTGAEESTDPSFLCAPARQRAEAFLRALGKWEEVQG